mmetsp:Transcript_24802/g.25431  ORF Transcript_24802/g.25431 Transcript_24802/m.25431 type:complete len:811 (-) Transcript_24802:16-2448(-)
MNYGDDLASLETDMSEMTRNSKFEDVSFASEEMSVDSANDFQSIHNNYTRGLLKGRHPRSFPRQSELWHHYKASSKRLERVSKGHKLWNILDEIEGEHHQAKLSPDIKPKRNVGSNFNDLSSSYIPKEPLHGLNVDLKGIFRMHYGMNVVIINSLDEVLCVNQHREVMCKTEEQLENTDEICFKIVDLTDPSNPGPLAYGKPIWLQILNSEEDNNIYYGFVLGAKLFGPPEMESTQLSQKRIVANKRNATQATNSPLSPSMSLNNLEVDSLYLQDEVRENTNNDKPILNQLSSQDLDFPDLTTQKRSLTPLDGKKNDGQSNKAADQAEICGGLSTLQAFHGSKDERLAGHHNHHHQQSSQSLQSDEQTRFRSRQASHLAMWTVQSALKTGPPEDYVTSCTPLYLEQDLYCLATSHGSIYDPWPRTVDVNKVPAGVSRKQMIKTQQLQATKKNSVLDVLSNLGREDEGTIALSNKNSHKSRTTLVKGDDPNQPTKVLATFTNNLPHGCLRRVVKRGAPYEHLVDRRCVWKFCVVDNPRDLKLLSVKEQRAQKLLRKARAGLNKSKLNRLGGRVHDGYTLPDGKSLTGGEKFPTMLRSIVSSTTLKLETTELKSRREKEEDINNYIKDLYKGCDVDNIEKFADGTISLTSAAKSKRKEFKFETEVRSPGSPADRNSRPTSEQRAQDRARRRDIGTKPKPISEPKYEVRDFSFGSEMLKIHQSFSAVNAKVTGGLVSKSYLHSYSNNPEGKSPGSGLNQVDPPTGPNATKISQKMELLAAEDSRVLLALRYREQLSKRSDMGSLFEDIPSTTE